MPLPEATRWSSSSLSSNEISSGESKRLLCNGLWEVRISSSSSRSTSMTSTECRRRSGTTDVVDSQFDTDKGGSTALAMVETSCRWNHLMFVG